MRKRPALHCERLEQRELPANSFSAGLYPVDVVRAVPQEAPARPMQSLGFEQNAAGQLRAPLQQDLSSDAVGAFFADHGALGALFPAEIQHQTDPGADPVFESFLPSWDGDTIHSPAQKTARVDDAQVWSFLRNYATKAIRREEFARGPLQDHADIIQQIYVEWREEVSAHDNMHVKLLDRDSAERAAFRGAVRRVLDRTRYESVKQRRRAELTEQADAPKSPSRDWTDMEIDLAQGVASLTDREREILDLRRWGATFEEIGAKFGLSRQRIFEAYSELLDRLTAIYRD